MKADSYIQEVEKCIQSFKVQLEKQQKELKEDERSTLNLLSVLYKKEFPKQNLNLLDPMKLSFPNRSVVNSLFKDDKTENFLFNLGQGNKRDHLAAERRAEYNAYLEKKERQFQTHRKVLEESRSVTPRSILESVDYEKVLAKRKEEESKFRNLNYAEPSVDNNISPNLKFPLKKILIYL
ncbi:hypothetical protein CEXT_56362 [Caerostris extrusa]|uniref:Uncharacterized protein n=1 Tax=Caerostris extrusa TaxID=172846 RepID=A0AAV4T4T0_CAEEX|nr:hypothetical protein CEXT_56362 [Caerostris extrusa]